MNAKNTVNIIDTAIVIVRNDKKVFLKKLALVRYFLNSKIKTPVCFLIWALLWIVALQ